MLLERDSGGSSADNDGSPGEPPVHGTLLDRSAQIAVVVLLLSAFPIIILFFGNERWFVADEWLLLTGSGLNVRDLLQPFNGHCIALPIVLWKVIFQVVGLRSYAPYQGLVVLAHLTVCAAVWIIARRAGVRPWIAFCGVLVLVYFGSGSDDILWAFQITLTGALALGLMALIITDIDRRDLGIRDVVGLVLSAAALLCSGVGVVAVFMVATATLLKRGWRVAAFHGIPLGLLYLGWYLVVSPPPSQATLEGNTFEILRRIMHWTYQGYVVNFRALGRTSFGATTAVAICLVLLIIMGLYFLAQRPQRRELVRQHSVVVACVLGSFVFLVLNGYERAGAALSYVGQTRYVYVGGALLLPLIVVAAEAVVSRVRVAAPVVLCLLLIGIPANLAELHAKPNAAAFSNIKDWVASVGAAPAAAASSPQTTLAIPYVFDVGVLWLAHLHQDGKLPPAPQGNVSLDNLVRVGVGMEQLAGRGPRRRCQVDRRQAGILIEPPKGRILDLDLVSDTKIPESVRDDALISMVLIDEHGNPLVGGARTVQLKHGHRFKILESDLRLRLTSSSGSVRVCR